MRSGMLPLGLILLILLAAVPPATAEEEAWLLRVERTSPGDLDTLLAAGIPVVHEMDTCLFVEGDQTHAQWLDDRGYRALLLDDSADEADYVVAGIRPDSDTDLVLTVGTLLHREDNWMLLRVEPGQPLTALAEARTFATRLSHESMRRPRPAPARVARSLGIDAPPDPLVQKIVDGIDTADIDQYWQDLTSNPPTGTRHSTDPGCVDAANYCKAVFDGLDIPSEFRHWSGEHAPNVEATRLGAVWPDRVYIVEGHLDDLPSSPPAPGADDNASGSVTVLEAANAMSCYAFKSTVKYLAVTGEEFGLYGSNAYADDALVRGEDIRGVINMDMNGWEGNGSPSPENLDINYNGPSEWLGLLFAECASKYGTGLAVDAFYCPSLSASDHYPFWQNGYHAICGITDNEGYCGHGGNYPYYHTSDDTIANCGDPTFFYGAVKASVATLAEMAEPFKITFSRDSFACDSADVAVIVGDRDLNTDPGLSENVAVEIWSDTETTPETLVLAERGPDDLVFDGVMAVTDQPPASGDGLLSVSPDDAIHARYVDAQDCDGAAGVTYVADARIDCTFPIIANVDEEAITDVSATVVWDTDETSTSVVRWSETTPPGGTASSEEMGTAHAVNLTGLQSCTVYYYEVESADEAGNVAVDDSGGQYYRFETYGDFGEGLQPCHAGRVTMLSGTFGCDDAVAFSLVDMDLNADPNLAETATLTVTSTTETVAESVVVTETGPNTSRFEGTIPTAAGIPAPDGVLQVGDGDVVTVTYLDDDDGTGVGARSFDTAVMDCGPPAIRNFRVEAITDQRMTVRFETDEPGDTVVEWGPSPALGEVETSPAPVTDHVTVLNRLDLCEPVYLRVSSTDAYGNTAVGDLAGQPVAAHTWDIPGLYWRETFENDVSGWDLEGEWEVGTPQGLGGSRGNPDPTAAYNNLRILGNDLTGLGNEIGDYEHAMGERATSPEFNAETWSNTRLLLYKQLNVRQHDVAAIAVVSHNQEDPVYSSAGSIVSDGAYGVDAYDVSALVDGQRRVNVRFLIQADNKAAFNDDGVSSGWNIDDVILKDGTLPDYAPCGGCTVAPGFAGADGAVDNDACGATGVTVHWPPAMSWGTGGAGTYSVYRDTAPGFTPSASNLVAFGVAGLAYDDATAPVDTTLYYVVRAENDETCGGGPANGGLTDDNLVYVQVEETTSWPVPSDHDGLRVDLVNGAHVRLSWDAVAGATSYRIYRSDSPDRASFLTLDETAELYHEDLNQGGNANTLYYLVRGTNPCGDEGP